MPNTLLTCVNVFYLLVSLGMLMVSLILGLLRKTKHLYWPQNCSYTIVFILSIAMYILNAPLKNELYIKITLIVLLASILSLIVNIILYMKKRYDLKVEEEKMLR